MKVLLILSTLFIVFLMIEGRTHLLAPASSLNSTSSITAKPMTATPSSQNFLMSILEFWSKFHSMFLKLADSQKSTNGTAKA
ncbi:unnamed protein product [Caenorhabditis sp. 36 PRJEB53466]|nr:unnamed protein product [Caenorhabditis sp. 36 PRJEB53466]